MKRIATSLVTITLGFLARLVVRRYRPTIVMVTGSVGKTSAKDAVAAVLSTRFFVRKSEKSFNSEFGVPFTIFGAKNPWGNPFAWVAVFKNALALLFLPNHYPTLLVLEVGADRPGDLRKILRIASPDAAVVTRLPDIPVHVEAYESTAAVREEEFSPALAVREGGPLIISADDPNVVALLSHAPGKVFSYGFDETAFVRVGAVDFHEEGGEVRGMTAEYQVDGESVRLIIKGAVGKMQALAPAAALAAGRAFGVPLQEAVAALSQQYEPPPGRGRLFRGKNNSIIIDDSYNASPVAVEEALTALKRFPSAKRRLVVLGDMLELGRYSVAEHERIGTRVCAVADVVVSVGVRARAIAEAARACEIPEDRVFAFEDSASAAEALGGIVKAGDVVLVKGSQSIRAERVVASLLANPEDCVRLVRQEPQWLRRK